jgi:hypothetical protein
MKENHSSNLSLGTRLGIGVVNIALALFCLILSGAAGIALLFAIGGLHHNPSDYGGVIFLVVSGIWLLLSTGLFLATANIAINRRRWNYKLQVIPFAGAVVLFLSLAIISRFLF